MPAEQSECFTNGLLLPEDGAEAHSIRITGTFDNHPIGQSRPNNLLELLNMALDRQNEQVEVELPLLRHRESHDLADEDPVFDLEEWTTKPAGSGLAAGVANMANSIIGAGIIGEYSLSIPHNVTWRLT